MPEAAGLSRDSQARPETRLSLPMARATGLLTPVIDRTRRFHRRAGSQDAARRDRAGEHDRPIPSAHTIAAHHQVSHRVAARALEILQGEGIIENVPGEELVVATRGRSQLRFDPQSPGTDSRCPHDFQDRLTAVIGHCQAETRWSAQFR